MTERPRVSQKHRCAAVPKPAWRGDGRIASPSRVAEWERSYVYVVNRNPDKTDLRKFGWAMLIGFGAIGLILWLAPWLKAQDAAVLGWTGTGAQVTALCLWLLGSGLCVVALAFPNIAKPVYISWMSVAVPIGIFMSTVLLTVLFVLLLPVFSMIVRFGDPLRKKLTDQGTYWEDYKPYKPTLERMKRPF